MISTILSGIIKVAMYSLDFFLAPIYAAISNINLGGTTVDDLLNEFLTVMYNISRVLPWLVDATGIPKPVIRVLLLVFLACLTLRLSVYVIKLIVKWWDRIVA